MSVSPSNRSSRRIGGRVLHWFALWILLGVPLAHAELTVSPPRVVLQAKPGQSRVGFFVVENTGDTPLIVKVQPEDWTAGLAGGRGPVPWLTVKPTKISLRPSRSARVKFTARVPKDANGELRAQVFFTVESAEGDISMRSRLGAIIYVGVEGTERVAATIVGVDGSYTASTPEVTQPDRLDILLRIYNQSNVHIVPSGEVVVRDRAGQAVATIPLPPGWGLLPNEEDKYHAIGHGIHLKPGRYVLEITILCGEDLRHPTTVTKTAEADVSKDGAFRIVGHSASTP